MRVVRSGDELEGALRSARSEAQSSFGSSVVYLEKYLDKVRHIEIQLLGDNYGNLIHLGERECSIQRRHQKLIEESPSVAVSDEMRERMGAVAVAAGKAAGYSSAGTVEFLVDREGNFYFLEVNTRLQVEHPVTELVTGVDLVLEQFRIASGRPLRIKQRDVRLRGHAIECRIAAEDPFNNFAPSLGTVAELAEPSGPGVRVDSSLYRGAKVSIYYDPMVAKLIVWAPTRAHAILRMRRALQEYRIVGVQSNIPFHLGVTRSMEFQRGRLDTQFVERHLETATHPRDRHDEEMRAVASDVAALVVDRKRLAGGAAAQHETGAGNGHSPGGSNWRHAGRRQGLR